MVAKPIKTNNKITLELKWQPFPHLCKLRHREPTKKNSHKAEDGKDKAEHPGTNVA
jgi:hypothetical protein